MGNVLQAIHTLIRSGTQDMSSPAGTARNRINAVGDSLENYIKDAFSDSLDATNEERLLNYSNTFSWTGNSNNPPDFMIKGGDAVEVKKVSLNSITQSVSSIQLNSSYPKQRLFSNDARITVACKRCEEWTAKDLLYCIGHVYKNRLRSVWLVYGDCFMASANVYERVANAITTGILETGLELSNTNELARVNKVDPLGITSLRVRGMWIITHPSRVFEEILDPIHKDYSINAIMLESKFNSFPEDDCNMIMDLHGNGLEINKIKIPSPDNPANLKDAIYIASNL